MYDSPLQTVLGQMPTFSVAPLSGHSTQEASGRLKLLYWQRIFQVAEGCEQLSRNQYHLLCGPRCSSKHRSPDDDTAYGLTK